MVFAVHKTFSLHFKTYFLRQHLKYLSETQGPQQTSTISIYLDIQLPGYKKSIKYQGIKIWNKI